MKLSEKFLDKMNKRQRVRGTPEYQLSDIKAYGLICRYEGGLTSTNDDGKRKFFMEQLIDIANELDIK